MIDAILCSTDRHEPWAAAVSFSYEHGRLSATLKKTYTHYQNLLEQPKAVIVFKKGPSEIICRVLCELENNDEETATANFAATWLRFVKDGEVSDMIDKRDIKALLDSRFGER